MKKILDYYDMKKMILEKIPSLRSRNFDEVVAVSRGGLTIAHIIAKELKLQVGVIFPSTRQIVFHNPKCKNILIIEDLIAEGRTTSIIHDIMNDHPTKWYYYIPFLVDADFGEYRSDEWRAKPYDECFMKTSDWIVFPWEENDSVVEGDRGLFRDNTDSYKGN